MFFHFNLVPWVSPLPAPGGGKRRDPGNEVDFISEFVYLFAVVSRISLQVLSQGSSPLAFLQEHIKNYIACVNDPKKEGCSDILNPPKRTPPKSGGKKPGMQLYFETIRHYA